jgi:hypothetical protein
VGFAGIFFLPVILAGFGYLRYHIPLAGSMSSYYHATRKCSGIKAQWIPMANAALELQIHVVGIWGAFRDKSQNN